MKRHSPEQRGAALLLILLLLVVAGSTFALGALNSNPALRAREQRELYQQMQRAKESLLAYAAHSASVHAHTRGPGYLPCPDTTASDPDNDGVVRDDDSTDCAGYDSSSAPLLGRLPIAIDAAGNRFELSMRGIGVDQRFWYAVGNRYVAISSATAPASALRNAIRRTSSTFADATSHRLTLDGMAGYVAVIIAPGEALASQNRAGGFDDHHNYLDGTNGDGYTFVSSFPADPSAVNDRMLGITLDEYMDVVGLQVILDMKKELDASAVDGEYPSSSGYVDFPLQPSAGSQDEFQAVFYSVPSARSWLRSDAVSPSVPGNGENWPDFTYYQQLSPPTRAQLVIAGCTGMVYTIDLDVEGVTRSGDSC
jgi:hypothetical protein